MRNGQQQRAGFRLTDQLGSTATQSDNQPCSSPRQRRDRVDAFTRVELVALLGALALLGTLTLPLLASNRVGSERAVCQGNLRQIGHAFISWADDHGGNFPFLIPTSEGGNNTIALANQIWFQYYWLSNEIRTPRILVCPADTEKRVVDDWSDSPETGFRHHLAADNSVSYVLAIGTRQSPHGLLSGDRNIKPTFRNSGSCAAGPLYGSVPSLSTVATNLDWGPGLHHYSGNLLLNDGSVLAARGEELRRTVRNSAAYGFTLCVIYPLPLP